MRLALIIVVIIMVIIVLASCNSGGRADDNLARYMEKFGSNEIELKREYPPPGKRGGEMAIQQEEA